jgi:hypothetical protein
MMVLGAFTTAAGSSAAWTTACSTGSVPADGPLRRPSPAYRRRRGLSIISCAAMAAAAPVIGWPIHNGIPAAPAGFALPSCSASWATDVRQHDRRHRTLRRTIAILDDASVHRRAAGGAEDAHNG